MRQQTISLALACGLVLGAAAPAAAEYGFVTKWGTSGSGDGQFHAPYGIATDSAGNVYVTDNGNGLGQNDRVEKFNSTGAFITKWGGLGSGDTEFHDPWGIATDSADHVYVADLSNKWIKKFDSDGVFIKKFGGPGPGDGQLSFPAGVAVDASGKVYVTDHDASTPIDRVQKFEESTELSKPYVYDLQWGTTGSGAGQFRDPHDVAVGPGGDVYVADRTNNRIEKFDSDGFFLAQWGKSGSGDGEFVFPEGVATDAAGNVYVADRGNNRIQKFSSSGAFITKWGGAGSGDGQFLQPNDVTVDADGNVYVVDTGNDRIQKFAGDGVPSGGGAGSAGGGTGTGEVIDVSNVFKIANTTVLAKDGKLKLVLNLPAPGIVVATATVKAPPRPPSLDPAQRKHEGYKSTVSKAKKKPPVVVARGRASAAAAGSLPLVVASNKRGKKYLGWREKLKASLKITYTPSGGAPRSRTLSVTFKLRAR